jgi:WD40 repeat protein/tRNA A-37 threonylcarbamoyl transferase component Bud32
MSVEAHGPCPAPDELERGVAAERVAEPLARHLQACQTCRAQAEQIVENLAFMRGLLRRLGPEALGAVRPAGLAPDAVPGYRILRTVGRGGQAVVHEAVQIATKRRVALKIVEGEGASPRARARLEREVELAASLRHPGIVSVYESVALPDGRMALAMEFVDGEPLDAWAARLDRDAPRTHAGCREAVRAKVRALLAVCEAVRHAHLNGVIHRDLKPGNVLVEPDGTVRVVDFGVARRAGHATRLTQEGGFAGTLAYASPEQVSGDPARVDARSDIFSLGLMLHEVLTGRPVRDAERPLTDVVRDIVGVSAPALATVEPGGAPADPDLRVIVGKMLAQEPSQRYQSAAALAADLENWLAGRAIDARRTSTAYVLRKLAARHRVGVAAGVLGALVVLVFAVAMTWTARSLAAQRALLADALSESTIERARTATRAGERARAEALIWPELIAAGGTPESPDLLVDSPAPVMRAAWALAELYGRHPSPLHRRVPPGAQALRFEEGGHALRVLLPDGAQRVYALPGGEERGTTPPTVPARAAPMLLSADRRHAIVADASEGSAVVALEGERAPGARPVVPVPGTIRDVSADGARGLFVQPEGVVTLRDIAHSRVVATLDGAPVDVGRPAFSGAGDLVLWGLEGRVHAVRALDGAPAGTWSIPDALWSQALGAPIRCIRMSESGAVLAASMHTSVLVWAPHSPSVPPRDLEPRHRGIVGIVELTPDGRTLVSSGSERVHKVWDVESGALRAAFEHVEQPRGRVVPSDDGALVAFCDETDRLRVFGTREAPWRTLLCSASNSVHRVAFSPDGALLAAAASDGAVRAWRADTLEPVWTHQPSSAPLSALAFSPDGRSLAVAERDGAITVAGLDGGEPAWRAFALAPPFTTWLGYSPDGRHLVALCGEPWCPVFDAATGAESGRVAGHAARVIGAAFAQDGALFTVGADGVLIAMEPDLRTERFRTDPVGGPMRAVAVAPGGALVATGSDDRRIRLWDSRTGEPRGIIEGLRQHTFDLAYHPAGNVLFSCGRDTDVQVWDTRTLRELASLEGHASMILALAISPDGRAIATAGADHCVGVWRLERPLEDIRGNADAWTGPQGD